MKIKNLKLVLVLLTVFLSILACNDDDDDNNVTIDFGTPPSSTLITNGSVTVLDESLVRYHVINFNALGGILTSTLIESEKHLVIIDVAFDPLGTGIGDDLRNYADAIGKQISIAITHAHSDHYGNIGKFTDFPVYAHTDVATALNAAQDFTSLYSKDILTINNPTMIGDFVYDIKTIINAEAEVSGVILIPSLKAVFVGDLATNKSHMGISSYTPKDDFDELTNWISALNTFKSDYGDYNYIFVGHNGFRDNPVTLIDESINYLQDAQGLIKGTKQLTSGGTAATVLEVTDELDILYPDWSIGALLFSLPDALFPGSPGADWF